jgi:hypothetical protein
VSLTRFASLVALVGAAACSAAMRPAADPAPRPGPGLLLPPLDEEPGTGGFSTTGAAQVATSFQGVEQYLAAADALGP